MLCMSRLSHWLPGCKRTVKHIHMAASTVLYLVYFDCAKAFSPRSPKGSKDKNTCMYDDYHEEIYNSELHTVRVSCKLREIRTCCCFFFLGRGVWCVNLKGDPCFFCCCFGFQVVGSNFSLPPPPGIKRHKGVFNRFTPTPTHRPLSRFPLSLRRLCVLPW